MTIDHSIAYLGIFQKPWFDDKCTSVFIVFFFNQNSKPCKAYSHLHSEKKSAYLKASFNYVSILQCMLSASTSHNFAKWGGIVQQFIMECLGSIDPNTFWWLSIETLIHLGEEYQISVMYWLCNYSQIYNPLQCFVHKIRLNILYVSSRREPTCLSY